MAKCTKIKNIFIVGFFLISSFFYAAVPQTKIISPVAGTWANPQSLIVDNEPGTEVFYSLNGEDPLVSGFAYDGPVLLEGSGKFKLTVISVSKEGTSLPKTIEYTVENKATPSYIKTPKDSPVIPMYKDSSIVFPQSTAWFAGYSSSPIPEEDIFQYGDKVALYSNCDIVNYIPLIIKENNSYYRYILKTGFSDSLRYSAPVPTVNGIEFYSWNYIRLSDGEKSLYSIDGSSWKETSTLIYVDRSVDHQIRWKKANNSDTEKEFFIPAKPRLIGVPEKGFTNQNVKLKLDSNDYQIGYNSPDGNLLFTKEIAVDTVTGDCASISIDFDIYFQGIKQGSINPSFLIDRRNPAVPTFESSAVKNFSREDVEINILSDDNVYYSISSPIFEPTGFASSDVEQIQKTPDKSMFKMLDSHSLVLSSAKDAAVFYTVYAYSMDNSGNCSNISSYSVIIDSKNYYVNSSVQSSTSHLGTKYDPLPSINEAITLVKSDNVCLYLDGSFVIEKPVTIATNCTILGKENTRLYFSSNAQLSIENAKVLIENCTLEKQVPQTGDVIQKNLLRIYNSEFIANNCEFVCYFDFSGNCITAKNSMVTLENSGLSIHASSYASAINAEDTLLNLYTVRISSSAKTAVGISASNNTCVVDNSEIIVIGSYTRACEFLSVVWNFQYSTLVSKNAIQAKNAIWMDSYSTKNVDFKNKLTGFTSLYIQAE